MKRIIFRNPFVTENDRRMAQIFLDEAEKNLSIAERYCKKKDGTYTDLANNLIIGAAELRNIAAIRLGFRNVKDMDEYKNRHGHF